METRRLIVVIFLLICSVFCLPAANAAISQQECVSVDAYPNTSLRSQASGRPTGEQTVAVFLVNFSDDLRQPFSINDVRLTVFGPVNDYVREVSYGRAWLTGEVYGWLTLPGSARNSTAAIASATTAAALQQGLNISNYNRYIYIFPTQNFTWGGMGTIGGKPSRAWINGDPSVRLLTHELGHNFGLNHANALVFPNKIYDSTTRGTTYDQADRYDSMGKFGVFHFNAQYKEQLGWLEPVDVKTSGTYEIFPLESAEDQIKSLKITTPSNRRYYLEYRQNIGFDQFNFLNVTNGALVHLDQFGSTAVLDMTPETVSLNDPALEVGRSYADPDGIIIRVVKKNPGSLVINIQLRPSDQAPIVVAGEDQTLTLPAALNLNGRVMFPGTRGSAQTTDTRWSMISGPTGIRFDNAQSEFTQATFFKSGSYVLRLSANDGHFATSDDVTINVYPEPGLDSIGIFANPFKPDRNPNIQIPYKLSAVAQVELAIFNILGEKLATLEDGRRESGSYIVPWDGRNRSGSMVGSDVYFVCLSANGKRDIKKLVVIR